LLWIDVMRRNASDERFSKAELRYFAWAAAVLLALVSARQPSPSPALFLRIAAGALFALGTVWPRSMEFVYRPLEIVTWPVRWLVSYVVLGAIYYGLITPLALWFRLRGRDVLGRGFDRQRASYWQPRPGSPEPASYFRQF
jgi:hypothetical protein